jgi:hypothetical protein
MIALVRLLPPTGPCADVERIDDLPSPTATLHSAYLVSCRDETEVGANLAWYTEARSVRPTVLLGLVCSPDLCAAALGRIIVPVRPVISPGALQENRVPGDALSELRAGSLESRIMESLIRKAIPRRTPSWLAAGPTRKRVIRSAIDAISAPGTSISMVDGADYSRDQLTI